MKKCIRFVFHMIYVGTFLQLGNTTFAQTDSLLARELIEIAKRDQMFMQNPPFGYEIGTDKYQELMDSVLTSHYHLAKEIYNKYGFPGYNLVGEEASKSFWLIVQHSDKWPSFQERVLHSMEKEVYRNNASSINYAYLVDRVNKNSKKKQIYGTQVSYNIEKCQAYIADLEDPENVNSRRKNLGLEPFEVYLNRLSTHHFIMNKKVYLSKGISGPTLYKAEENIL